MEYGFLIWALITIFIHELGHFYIARKYNIYQGWGILPTPHVKLKKPFNRKNHYLSGLYASILTILLWIMIVDYNLFYFFVSIILLAIGDIFLFLYFKKI